MLMLKQIHFYKVGKLILSVEQNGREEAECVENKKNTKFKVILLIIIAVNLAGIIYCFTVKKEGWHSDEVWSYGFANSYYKAHVYQNADGELDNIDEWVNSKVLNDYIEVNDGERFAFGSVYNNQIKDLSPPLHSMILHAICSLFPNTFSWWYSFSINIIAFIICMVFLYKTATVMKNEQLGLVCCILYGISMAARDTYIYLRMYAMCTAMSMILFYNMTAYISKFRNKKVLNKNLVAVFITSFLMFLTHYYMIPWVGFITLGACVILFSKKEIKRALAYGCSQLISLIMALLAFPSVINVFVGHQTNVNDTAKAALDYKLPAKMKILANFISYKLYGIHISVYNNFIWLKVGVFIIVGLIILLIPLVYLLRDTHLVKKIFALLRCLRDKFIEWFINVNKLYFVIFIVVILQMLVVAGTSQVVNMGWHEGRYIMYLYPFVTLFFSGMAYSIIAKIKKKKIKFIITICLVTLICIVNLFFRKIDTRYYFENNTEGVSLEKVVKNKDCIFVSSENWATIYMTPILRYSNEYFQTSKTEYDKYTADYVKKQKNEIILIVDFTELDTKKNFKNSNIQNIDGVIENTTKKYEEILNYYKRIYSSKKCEKVSTQNVFGRVMEAYVFR